MSGIACGRLLHLLRDPPLDGPGNMARDEHLLYAARLRPAALRIYSWSPPTISLGYFQRFADLAGLPAELRPLPVVRRPTGGGAILHDRELTYCLVIDDVLPPGRQAPAALYRLVHECWQAAIAGDVPDSRLAPDSLPSPSSRGRALFCFAKPGRTDLLLGADKLLGSAQRRIPGRVLQHGSLLLGRRFAAHPGADLGDPPRRTVEAWIAGFVANLASRLGLSAQPTGWTATELREAAGRRQRYAGDQWTRRR